MDKAVNNSHGSSSVIALVGSTPFVILPRFFSECVDLITSFLDLKLQDRDVSFFVGDAIVAFISGRISEDYNRMARLERPRSKTGERQRLQTTMGLRENIEQDQYLVAVDDAKRRKWYRGVCSRGRCWLRQRVCERIWHSNCTGRDKRMKSKKLLLYSTKKGLIDR